MSDQDDYQSLLTDLIKKQMVMLGPGVAIAKARKISGLAVADDGQVADLLLGHHLSDRRT